MELAGFVPRVRLHKKGMFFTLAGIFLVLLLLIFISGVDESSEGLDFLDQRLLTTNALVDSVIIDAQFALDTSFFRTFLALSEHVASTGQYLDDVYESLNESIYTGSVENASYYILENNTISDWKLRIENYLAQFDLDLNVTLSNVTWIQDNPWEVRIDAQLQMHVFDMLTNSTWNITKPISSTMSIEGIPDPVFIMGTNNKYPRPFNQTPFTSFVNGTNVSDLTTHMEKGYYLAFADAPSFLQRFEGDFSASANGIESLVDKAFLDQFSDVDVDDDLSNVDYVYFQGKSPTTYNVSGMPAEFHLDNYTANGVGHVQKYNVSGLLI